MALRLRDIELVESKAALQGLPAGKLMINTINAHSYNVAQTDEDFSRALQSGVLVPDGASIVKACRWLRAKSQPVERIAGWDLFEYEMSRLREGQTVMFMGSSERVLSLIRKRAKADYPGVKVTTYSPPYKPQFTAEEDKAIVEAINLTAPDLLWIGMTAPKQEKWLARHWDELNISCHAGTIGAVFDFYAGTIRRAPVWWQRHSLEWLYRLLKEPRRMWRRYLVGNVKFLWNTLKESH